MIVSSLCLIALMGFITRPTDHYINPAQKRQILRQPDGLKKLAEISGGHYSAKSTRSPGFAHYNIETATKQASLILVGEVTSSKTVLTDAGDSIETRYEVQPERILKGSVPQHVIIVIYGGKFAFPNGDTAQIDSIASSHVETGKRYLFFLNKDESGTFLPLGDYQMIFDVSSLDTVVSLAKYDTRRHLTILRQIQEEALTAPEILVQKIKGVVEMQEQR